MPMTAEPGEEARPASRKRSFDQITRSQSRSATPDTRRTKRRRTTASQPLVVRGYSPEVPAGPATGRFVGDGLDMRRPVSPLGVPQEREVDTIDLTLDDDEDSDVEETHDPYLHGRPTILSPHPAYIGYRNTVLENNARQGTSLPSTREPTEDPLPSLSDSHPSIPQSTRDTRLRRIQTRLSRSASISSSIPNGRSIAGRIQPSHLHRSAEIIDLTDVDDGPREQLTGRRQTSEDSADYEQFRRLGENIRREIDFIDAETIEDIQNNNVESSSDVEITGVRQVPRNRRGITTLHLSPDRLAEQHHNLDPVRRPPSLNRANAQSFSNSQSGVGMALNQINQFMRGLLPGRHQEHINPGADFNDGTGYDDIQMDATLLDRELRLEDPTAGEMQRDRDEAEYKAPPKPRCGFTRDILETGDMLVCVGCEDELGMGDEEDVRSQVWVSRRCGHVYCGACNQRRVQTRGGNDRSRKKARVPNPDVLKECAVDKCKTKLTGKTAMFQIYL